MPEPVIADTFGCFVSNLSMASSCMKRSTENLNASIWLCGPDDYTMQQLDMARAHVIRACELLRVRILAARSQPPVLLDEAE